MDFASLFQVSVDPLEIVVRGTTMYWFLFLLFRIVLRRDTGSIGIADILLVVIIADASQNAMAGSYESITDGMILVATIAGWNYLLDWSSYHFGWVRRLLVPKPLPLISDGRVLRHNLRYELVTIDELKAKLREQGIERFSQVKQAFMESDGEISILRADEEETQKPKKPESGGG
ncbi:MAG: DUF421 domain-containing protein [Betaproteobacteria bacterium]